MCMLELAARSVLASILVLGMGSGCKKTPATRSPVTLATDTVTDPSGVVEVEIAYTPRPERQIELSFELRAIGIAEMDKIVLEVRLDGFHLVDGQIEWTGFVPPRQPQSHRLTVQAAEDVAQAQIRVSVRRSVDSTLLMEREIAFSVTGDGVKPI